MTHRTRYLVCYPGSRPLPILGLFASPRAFVLLLLLASIADTDYGFDSVFTGAATQDDVYDSIGPPIVIRAAKHGINSTLLAYGRANPPRPPRPPRPLPPP